MTLGSKLTSLRLSLSIALPFPVPKGAVSYRLYSPVIVKGDGGHHTTISSRRLPSRDKRPEGEEENQSSQLKKFKEEGEVKSYLDLLCIQIPNSSAALCSNNHTLSIYCVPIRVRYTETRPRTLGVNITISFEK